MAAKDNLKDLLQERFTDHEVGVDPGVWQAISTQLVATAPVADGLGDLLKERFRDHEAPVDPGVWEGISQQLGHGAAAGTAVGGSGLGGWIAAGIAATVVTGGLLFWALSPEPAADVTADTKTAVIAPAIAAPAPIGPSNGSTSASRVATSSSTATPATRAGNDSPAAPALARNNVQPSGPGLSGQQPGVTPNPGPATSNPPEGEHIDEVNRIIDRLIEQTKAEPIVAQTESLPEAGLVQGKAPELSPSVIEDPADEQGDVATPSAPVVWIPNAFSPGQRDGINDEFEVVAEGLTGIQVRIYSLDSRLVFSANDLKAWNGHDLTGQLCPQGYYFYAIEGLDGSNKTFSKGQTIYLFR